MSLNLHSTKNENQPIIQLSLESLAQPAPSEPAMQVIRRNGTVSKFDPSKISIAMTKAFLAVEGHTAAASRRVHEVVEQLTQEVTTALTRRVGEGRTFHIEDVQDQVELALMRSEHHKVARAYVLYREERARQRAEAIVTQKASAEPVLHTTLADGSRVVLNIRRLEAVIAEACAGLDGVDAALVLAEARRNLYDGIGQDELALASIMASRTLVEQEPNYSYVSSRLLLDKLRGEVLSFVHGIPTTATQAEMAARYADYFSAYVKVGIQAELLDPELSRFDLARLAAAIKPERDLQFQFLGCRRYMTAISCMCGTAVSNCRRLSLCASPWVSRCARSTARHAPSNSTICCPRSTSWRPPDVVQLRNASSAALVLLPDNGG
jgi:ribonucleoside-diphosphate reductase alpha chain